MRNQRIRSLVKVKIQMSLIVWIFQNILKCKEIFWDFKALEFFLADKYLWKVRKEFPEQSFREPWVVHFTVSHRDETKFDQILTPHSFYFQKFRQNKNVSIQARRIENVITVPDHNLWQKSIRSIWSQSSLKQRKKSNIKNLQVFQH